MADNKSLTMWDTQPRETPTENDLQNIFWLLSQLATTYETHFDSLADAHQAYDELGETAHDICVSLGIVYDDPEADGEWGQDDDD